jgi:hypothetical protein
MQDAICRSVLAFTELSDANITDNLVYQTGLSEGDGFGFGIFRNLDT